MLSFLKQAAGSAIGVLIGLAAGAALYAHAAPKQEAAQAIIRAQGFILVDKEGNEMGGLEYGDMSKRFPKNKLGIGGETASLVLFSPNLARQKNGESPGASASVVGLSASDGGFAGLNITGIGFKGAGYGHSTFVGLMGPNAIPTVKLSSDVDDKKIRIITP